MYERIVAGTDFSKTAAVATKRASILASRLGAELTIVHAGNDPGESLAEIGRELGAEVVARSGPPAEVLIAECERLEAGLLVVGSVGMTGARRFLLGSVPNKISHHASSDLLIVKTDPPPKEMGDYKKILVGTDGSPTATKAVDMACGLAARIDARPTIVCVFEPLSDEDLERLRADPSDAVAQWHAHSTVKDVPEEFRWRIAGASQAEDVLDRAGDHAARAGVGAELRAVEGYPAEALIMIAEQESFDLVIVGSVGMTGPRRFMLGNVPHRISHHSPTDLLILHTT